MRCSEYDTIDIALSKAAAILNAISFYFSEEDKDRPNAQTVFWTLDAAADQVKTALDTLEQAAERERANREEKKTATA